MSRSSPSLDIGILDATGQKFTLPLDAVAETFAVIGIRGSGKTTTVKRIAEQMCKAGLPWIAFDPVGVWWGLRANKDGSPSNLPVVVFGGKHGDIPINKGDGKLVARAVVRENICAVIDVFRESKAFWRHFLAEMCLELMELEPDEPRHVFIEEAPEFVPQKGRTDLTQRTKEAVERLIRLGRNQGYGATLISQRSATVDKDVLSQCENLFVMRSTGKHDRKALQEWVDENAEGGEAALGGLSKLESGQAYFWSPAWLKQFDLVKIHEAETHHPGKTRRVGAAKTKIVTMGDVGDFVERVQGQLDLAAVEVDEAKPKRSRAPRDDASAGRAVAKAALKETEGLKAEVEKHLAEVTRLREKCRRLEPLADEAKAARAALERTRKALQPLYDGLRGLYAEAGTGGGGGAVDMDVWEPWLAKAAKKGARKMLTLLLERPELTKQQLATLAGVSMKGGTFRTYLSWLRSNGLVRTDGDRVVLLEP